VADNFLAEIRIFPFNFAPKGWAFCNGQLMLISQNTALFSLLGTNYGGNGTTTFGLPNLQGAAAMHSGGGQGPGLSPHDLGEFGGSDNVTLLSSEMPAHSHVMDATTQSGLDATPNGEALGKSVGASLYQTITNQNLVGMAPLTPAGSSFPHNNLAPYLTLNFCIALQGIFPPRS